MFPFPWDLIDPGTELGSPGLQADSLPSESPGKPLYMFKTECTFLYSTIMHAHPAPE